MKHLRWPAAGLLLLSTASCARWNETAEGPRSRADHGISERRDEPDGSDYLGAPVRTPDGVDDWVVEELLLQRRTGELAGVVLVHDDEQGAPVRTVVEPDALTWSEDEPLTAELRGEGPLPPDRSDLFEGLGRTFLSGRITQVQELPDRVPRAAVIKVHDDENLLHRVLVEPASLAEGVNLTLAVGKTIGVRGVLTRDATGKLLIADSLTQNQVPVELRDPTGALAWDTLTRPYERASELVGDTITTDEGIELEVVDWSLDPTRSRVDELQVRIEAWVYALPWSALIPTNEPHGWRTERSAGTLDVLSETGVD